MGTLFKDIYSLNSIIKDDSRLQNKTTNQIYELYFLYLKYAISYFLYDSKVDLTNYTPFTEQEYLFTSDGVDKQYSLIPSPPLNCEFYIGFRENSDLSYTQTFDYTFDSNTNVITINNNPAEDYEVYISGFIVGSFDDTLNLVEQRILSEGMNVPFDQEKVQRESLLTQLVYGGTTKLYSQANHIKEVNDVAQNQYYKIVKAMINDYSFKSNDLTGLGGGIV